MSPTANTSSSKPRAAKAAPKATGAKRANTGRAGKTATSATRRSSTTPARRGTASTRARTTTGTIDSVGTYAERAVLIPVGAALIARDRLLAGVNELPRDPSTANAKAQAQLRRFERRGSSARNSLEREARRTRVRLERELRRRRGELDRAVSDFDRHRSTISRSLTGQVEEASTTVQARVKDATSLAGKVQERILDLV